MPEAPSPSWFDQAVAVCENQNLHPMIYEQFSDPDFLKDLPEAMKEPATLAKYLDHSSRFADVMKNKDIRGDIVTIDETPLPDGNKRHAEKGQRILVDVLKEKFGIDPNFVLFFRLTQPSETAKPEHYWTSDWYETQRGLTQEVRGAARDTAITLCSSLEQIDTNSGLIEDVNDDNGLAVRRIDTGPFAQKLCLAVLGGKKAEGPVSGMTQGVHAKVEKLL